MNSQNQSFGTFCNQNDSSSYSDYYAQISTPLSNYNYTNYYLLNNNNYQNYYTSQSMYSSSNYNHSSDLSYENSSLFQRATSSPQNHDYNFPTVGNDSYITNYKTSPIVASPIANITSSRLNTANSIQSPESIVNASSSSSSSKQNQKRSRVKNHQPLPATAIDILNEWFETHISHPYPTNEDKHRLAEQTGITVKQINSWFCNRRNRSQNTKPKRIKRQLEQKITNAINELALNPNQTHVIEKVINTLFK